MVSRFTLKWRMGCRTVALMSEVLEKYDSTVALQRADGAWTCAKRVVEWWRLNLKAGSKVSLLVLGADAAACRRELATFFNCGEEQRKCPVPECDSTPILLRHEPKNPMYGCSNWHTWTAADPKPRS